MAENKYETFDYKFYIPVLLLFKEEQVYVKFILATPKDKIKNFTLFTPTNFPHIYTYDSIGPFSIEDETLYEKTFEYYQKLYNKLFTDSQTIIEFKNPKQVIKIPKEKCNDIWELQYLTHKEFFNYCDHKTVAGTSTYKALFRKVLLAFRAKKVQEDEANYYIILY